MKPKKIITPLDDEIIRKLKVGDEVSISGIIYSARDQAHKKLCAAIKRGNKLPFNPKGQIIYYLGPAPKPLGKIIGSAGPTTSGRMDDFTPTLLKHGLKGMIGKGRRNAEVISAIKKHKAVYFAAVGGAGAYLSKFIKSAEIIAYPELNTEAIYKLTVIDFPAIVAIDTKGKSIYQNSPLNSL
ncbi:MAG TPA: Fe-S-containing hydro-lyase [Elusimicrobiales bacterium]|nr:Fe-S-containing hydro-lyase [Elusimicrobiales bacterium]